MKTAVKSVVFGLAVIAVGLVGMRALAGMRKDPETAPLPEDVLRVTAVAIESETVQVMIPGLGIAKALDAVAIAPEVAGTVVEVHPSLDVGGIIPEGDAIFVIDPSSYQARKDEAQAAVAQLESQLERLKTQYGIDQKRLETLERSRDLAKTEFERRKNLLESDDVGSQSDVDAQERAYNATIDAVDQLAQVVRVYPMRIAEADAGLASARARLNLAAIDLKRTRVVAPFTGRVTANSVDVGQYISPGRELVHLADDSILEIAIPIESEDARDWIQYKDEPMHQDIAWFRKVKPVDVEVRWTEATDQEHCWVGTLHRVGEYDEESRQIRVIVRVEGEDASPVGGDGLPLVNGMFCSVKIPGHTVDDVYRVPDGLVTHERTMYMAVDGRLKTVPVEIVYRDRDSDAVLVRAELEPDWLLITTRLTNPLENVLLDVIREDEESTE